jgi:hypothetical protein
MSWVECRLGCFKFLIDRVLSTKKTLSHTSISTPPLAGALTVVVFCGGVLWCFVNGGFETTGLEA